MRFLFLWAKLCKKIRGKAIIHSKIHETSKIGAGSHIVNTWFDRYSYCGYDCAILNCDVGAFCSISDNVVIGGPSHPMEWVSTSPVFYSGRNSSIKRKFSNHIYSNYKRTSIGNDVWIGENALIKSGVSIGDGSVIGMGSVVTKNVEKYAIVAGNPARLIRKRFDDQTIDKLSQTEWWQYSEEDLLNFAQCFNNPGEFIKKVEEKDLMK